jgi:integrase/recombinase XerD
VSERRLTIKEPKSGEDAEVAFMSEQVARRLGEYIKQNNLDPEAYIFPLCYSTVRAFITNMAPILSRSRQQQ